MSRTSSGGCGRAASGAMSSALRNRRAVRTNVLWRFAVLGRLSSQAGGIALRSHRPTQFDGSGTLAASLGAQPGRLSSKSFGFAHVRDLGDPRVDPGTVRLVARKQFSRTQPGPLGRIRLLLVECPNPFLGQQKPPPVAAHCARPLRLLASDTMGRPGSPLRASAVIEMTSARSVGGYRRAVSGHRAK